VSEPSYPIQVRAAIEHGGDFIRVSADGARARLDVQGLARDSATGALLRLKYSGKVDLTGPIGVILRGEAGAATTGFGDACELFIVFVLFCLNHFLHSFRPAVILMCLLVSQRCGI
jgi:hypothetical protein